MSPAADGGWSSVLRRAPLGVLVLAVVLGLLAAGLVIGGAYMALARADTGWVPWTAALLLGPLLLYVALHLVRLASWAWQTIFLLLVLLLISSIARLLAQPDTLTSPLVEIAVEVGFLKYMTRPQVRRAFSRQ